MNLRRRELRTTIGFDTTKIQGLSDVGQFRETSFLHHFHDDFTETGIPFGGNKGSRVIFLFLRSERAYFIAMKAWQIEYPESWPAAAGSSAERFEDEARMALAMKLYEMGRLTSGQAAQLAGVSRATFLLNCPQWNVPTVAWDSSELASEFKPFPA